MDRLKRAKELRDEAERLAKRLEAEAVRPLPDKWEVGMRVRFLRKSEWAWDEGTEATVIKLDEDCPSRRGDEYQVFWTSPDDGGARWWTTPDDVELVYLMEDNMDNDWIENERKMFEASAVRCGFNVQRSKRTSTLLIDDYANITTGNMWVGWLAAKQSMVSSTNSCLPNYYLTLPNVDESELRLFYPSYKGCFV